ncbi:hypothetical protein BACCAP_00356 [Pseudoflavonifractor capillosus ATCC 29799]|uniref:Uncharacterized protein n=1 Tax=Pseudoflavonifractor capillosus ATCC 29799 TaxID=411467 RepID=A6NQ86_9FIRM|nr:hypothetical protein BACCAP_00356 [Pseudoflavonifractor capillosus ATCC 29799]
MARPPFFPACSSPPASLHGLYIKSGIFNALVTFLSFSVNNSRVL